MAAEFQTPTLTRVNAPWAPTSELCPNTSALVLAEATSSVNTQLELLHDVGPVPMQAADAGTMAVQDVIEADACIPVESPLIQLGPRFRRARTPASVQILQRSGRLVSWPRAVNATVQAQRLLLKKLGTLMPKDTANADIDKKFRQAFSGNMSSAKQEQ